MNNLMQLVLLLCIGLLGYLVKNNAVTISVTILVIMKLTPLSIGFTFLEKNGVKYGVIILTIAVMSPLISGSLPLSTLIKSFTQWDSLIAIVIGVFVSWVGGRGVSLMSSQPTIFSGLLVGTLLGVSLFKGVPVGPLIAAGLVSLCLSFK